MILNLFFYVNYYLKKIEDCFLVFGLLLYKRHDILTIEIDTGM